MPELHGIFSDSVLPSRSGRQQGQHNIYSILQSPISLCGNLKAGCLALFFYYFMFNLYEVILFVIIMLPPVP